jgi:hypothetical protein
VTPAFAAVVTGSVPLLLLLDQKLGNLKIQLVVALVVASAVDLEIELMNLDIFH